MLKADDLTKANDPKKKFFWLKADDHGQSRRSYFAYLLYIKAGDHSENLKGEGRSHDLHWITIGSILNYDWSANWDKDWLRVQLGLEWN